jgi:hypothetical protein
MNQLYREESHGTYGMFALEINVDATKIPDLKHDRIWRATHDAAKAIKSAIMETAIESNPEAQQRRKDERAEILALFSSRIFSEEIPNGYCSDYCCKHLPWFVVTTNIGRFKIGWRKRVIHIEWTETHSTKTAQELFPAENVTKADRTIHAWSIEDAKRYVETILGSSDKPTKTKGTE